VTWLLVALGAAVGAPARYLIDRAVQDRHRSRFPWGTLVVNVLGSLILGLVAGATLAHAAPDGIGAMIGTGLCGALTTYSTFSLETVRLLEQRAPWAALANAAVSILAGLGAVYLGLSAAAALWS
jgi:CrcB protein